MNTLTEYVVQKVPGREQRKKRETKTNRGTNISEDSGRRSKRGMGMRRCYVPSLLRLGVLLSFFFLQKEKKNPNFLKDLFVFLPPTTAFRYQFFSLNFFASTR